MTFSKDILIQKAVSGDTSALADLLHQHGPEVQSRLRIARQWRAVLEPEDVMQVTYLEAFMQIAQFDPQRGSFGVWLARIAANNLRDAVRGLQRQKHPQPSHRITLPGIGAGAAPSGRGDSFQGLLEILGTTSHTPSRVAGHDEMQWLMSQAIDQLPADYAPAVRLYDLDGNSIAEVARQMKRSSGAVHMLRARAHDCLRGLLGTESMFFSSPLREGKRDSVA